MRTAKLVAAMGLAACANVTSADVLFNNGGFVTHPAQGFGGADASQLPSPGNSIGENQNLNALVRVAEDFVVPAGQTWTLNKFTTFGYQTGSVGFTFTDLVVRIWDRDPADPLAVSLFGDITTNILNVPASGFSNIYRTTTALGLLNNQRPVQRLVATLPNVQLPPGTYWVEWSTRGTGASGPFIPPVTILNDIPLGNAQIWRNAPWAPVVDIAWNLANYPAGQPIGLPFILEGTSGGGGGCYANCDGSTTPPILNVLDFVCFQTAYAQGSSTANCDGSTTPPTLNVLDFICFQTKYAQGCP